MTPFITPQKNKALNQEILEISTNIREVFFKIGTLIIIQLMFRYPLPMFCPLAYKKKNLGSGFMHDF